MTLDTVLSALNVTNSIPEVWIADWDRVQQDFSEDSLPILQHGFFSGSYGNYGLSNDIVGILNEAAATMKLSEPLARLGWLWYRLVIVEGQSFAGWPVPAEFPLFIALVLASGFPSMCDKHRERGISREITFGNCRDLEIWMRHEKRTSGHWGFKQLGWMLNHVSGRLYRLGRLQFIHQPYRGSAYAFRENATGRVIAFSAPGVVYTRKGFVNGTNDIVDENAWTATYECSDSEVRGYPITRDGVAVNEPVSLDRSEWVQLLGPEMPTLDIHIPEDGRLDPAQCLESFRMALEFYPKHFADLPAPVAFTCSSWLLDSQFAEILPGDSNIVKFLSLFHRFPLKSDDYSHFWRIFGEMPADLTKAPRDTSLQRAVLDFTLSGGRLRDAGGFRLI